jgi:hypothetical protein
MINHAAKLFAATDKNENAAVKKFIGAHNYLQYTRINHTKGQYISGFYN